MLIVIKTNIIEYKKGYNHYYQINNFMLVTKLKNRQSQIFYFIPLDRLIAFNFNFTAIKEEDNFVSNQVDF